MLEEGLKKMNDPTVLEKMMAEAEMEEEATLKMNQENKEAEEIREKKENEELMEVLEAENEVMKKEGLVLAEIMKVQEEQQFDEK